MRTAIEGKVTSGRRIHKSDLFVREFYEERWPFFRNLLIISFILNIGLTLCLFL